MKRRAGLWLIAVVVCFMVASAGVARAQVSVAVTSTVSIVVSPGDNIPNAGAFTVTNSSGSAITISAVNLSATNPGVFSSLTLTGQVPGSAAVASLSSPNPPSTSNTFSFAALPALPDGQTATFSLSGVASSTVAPTPTPSADSGVKSNRVAYAGIMLPQADAHSKTHRLLLTVLALGMLLMTGKLRRRHLVVLAMALILAATEVGCGNNTTSVTGTSNQVVETITVSSGGTPTGLPASLGSVTVQ